MPTSLYATLTSTSMVASLVTSSLAVTLMPSTSLTPYLNITKSVESTSDSRIVLLLVCLLALVFFLSICVYFILKIIRRRSHIRIDILEMDSLHSTESL